MRKFSRGAMAATVGSMLFLTATATAAHAVDFVSDSINGLSSKSVYVDSSASLANANQISDEFDGNSVGVAVLPEMATSTFNAKNLADQILQGTKGQYETVIVAIDGRIDSFGVASNGDAVQIATSLNEANNGEAGPALIASADAIIQSTSQAETGSEVSGSVDTTGFLESPVGIGLIVAAILFGVARLYVVVIRGIKKKTLKSPIMDQNLASLPEDLKKVTEKFRSLYAQHVQRGNTDVSEKSASIIKNLQELFIRIQRKGTKQQERMASMQYLGTLEKLNSALGEDYYLDIQTHPELWNNSEERLREVQQALDATSEELVKNIRNFNESRDLEFKVALESLSRSVNETSVNDLYSPTDTKSSSDDLK